MAPRKSSASAPVGQHAAVPTMLQWNARHGFILAGVLLALMIDGIAINLISLVAPLLMKDWQLTEAQMGPIMASALLGMIIGTSAGGLLGDRIGCRKMLLAAMIIFGLATLATPFLEGHTERNIARFVAGLGFGTAAPNGLALVADWLPSSVRTKAVVLLSVAVPLGGAIGAAGVGALVPSLGWQGCFLAVGGLSLAIAVVVAAFVPESSSYLVRSGKVHKAHAAFLRIYRTNADENYFEVRNDGRSKNKSIGVPQAYRRLLYGTMLIYFCIQFVIFGFAGWATVFLTDKGFSLSQALTAVFLTNAFGVIGALSTSFLVERFGSFRLLAVCFAVSLVAVIVTGFILANDITVSTHIAIWAVDALIAITSLMLGSASTTVWTVMAAGYPPEVRGTGVGLGLTAGRIGSAAILLTGGSLLAFETQVFTLFFLAMAVALVVAVSSLKIIDRHIAPKRRAAALP